MNEMISYVTSCEIYNVFYCERLLNSMTREEIIAFLAWNDHNGIYTDEQSARDGMKPLTRDLAIEKALEVISENKVDIEQENYYVQQLNKLQPAVEDVCGISVRFTSMVNQANTDKIVLNDLSASAIVEFLSNNFTLTLK